MKVNKWGKILSLELTDVGIFDRRGLEINESELKMAIHLLEGILNEPQPKEELSWEI